MTGAQSTQPHYLHEQPGLQPVLKPPVQAPRAIGWFPRRENLLVATASGELFAVDPVMGTRQLGGRVEGAELLVGHEDGERFVVATADGSFRLGSLADGVAASSGGSQDHGEPAHGVAFGDRAFVVVARDRQRWLCVVSFEDASLSATVRLPDLGTVVVDSSGVPLAIRSVRGRIESAPLKKGSRFPAGASALGPHELVGCGEHILGVTPFGVCAWSLAEPAAPVSMRMAGVMVGEISRDGQLIGLGTIDGAVAVARRDQVTKRVRPDLVRAFDERVERIAFADRGRWLASVAERLIVWTWDP